MDAPRPTSDQPEKHEAGDGNHAPQSTSELAADLTLLEQNISDNADADMIVVGIEFARSLAARVTDLEARRREWQRRAEAQYDRREEAEAQVAALTQDNAVLRELPSREVVARAEAAEAEVARLEQEREGYKRDFLAARERSEIQETRLRMLQEAVSEYLAYPTLAGRRERLELILADLNPDGGSKGFSGGA